MSKVEEQLTPELMHYGMPRRSGRYPWGSGEDPYQRSIDFLGRVEELRKNGWKETPENIMEEFGLTTTEYRKEKTLAREERTAIRAKTARSMMEDGLSRSEVARRMGVKESTIRGWENPDAEARRNKSKEVADFIRARVDEKGMVDVSTGTARELNISDKKLADALYRLQIEGYPIYKNNVEQATNAGKFTRQQIICKPGTEYKEIYNLDKIASLKEYISRDGGETFETFRYPASLDSKRLKIRYAEEGGIEKDGVIELRRGVPDLSLGGDHYSQVRILVDDSLYLKGMAVYSDNMPDGVDVIFNTNKKVGTPMPDVLKKIKVNADGSKSDNPFGALIKTPGGQSEYDAPDGTKKLSLINKKAAEGDWEDWADALPSQFLGKQNTTLVKKQLGIARADTLAEYDEICSLTNPTIKKHLLEEFASNCDAKAVHLKAAALPGQKYHVILPVSSMKDTEVYAPRYENGTKLALVRYPHGGLFEIPILTVNNKQRTAKELIGTSIDAVCVNHKVAERLSGADFDGDTVMCIPTHDPLGRVKISNRDNLKGLEGFDAKEKYGTTRNVDADGNITYTVNGRPVRIMKNTDTEMGIISNLITDMTIVGADDDDLAAAVRHSMVVIDAEKHKLDYRQSELDNNISALKKRYQKRIDENGNEVTGGASTILSRAKGEYKVPKRQGTPKINIKGDPDYNPNKPEGSLLYKEADDLWYPIKKYDKTTGQVTLKTEDGKTITYNRSNQADHDRYNPVKQIDENGKVTYTNKDRSVTYAMDYRKQSSTRMAETDDAFSLVSSYKHPTEIAYAEYANDMKALANKARLEIHNTGKIPYSASAKAVYAEEVKSLDRKLNEALLNAPREREAQRRTSAYIKTLLESNPDMKKSDIKKERQRAIVANRAAVSAVSRRDRNIEISDKEWEAIQSGAISENKLRQILANTDTAKLRERATPRTSGTALSEAKINRIRNLSSSCSIAEIADYLGVSTSTVTKYLKGAK